MLRPLRVVLLPEGTHLRLGRRHRAQLAFHSQPFDESLLQNHAALIVRQPATPLLLGGKARGPQLCFEVELGGELLPDVLDGLFDLVLDLLLGHPHARVAAGLLHQQLLIHHVLQDLPPHGHPPGGVVRDQPTLRLGHEELLLDLRREDRCAADHRDDAIDEPGRRRLGLTGCGASSGGEQHDEA